MSAKPQLLFLSHCLPYPPNLGVAIRSYNILRQLTQEFCVHAVMFSRAAHQADGGARDAARRALEMAGVRVAAVVPIAAEWSVARRAGDHLKSLATGRAYTYYEYESDEFRRHLDDVLARCEPSLIHVDSLDLHGWIESLPARPIACTHHDIESDIMRQRAANVRSRVLASYIRLQADRIERVERELCPRFSTNVVMSQVDAERLARHAPGARTTIVPNGVDTHFFTPLPASTVVPHRVAFVGGTHLFPNSDAVDYLLSEIWPRVRARCPAASLRLIGRSTPANQARYDAAPGVRCLGQVDDVRPHVAEAACTVVPIRVGGGTRIKILDAWAMGRPVVASSRGCEGLCAIDGENILIRDTPEEFADAVLALLSDATLRERLAKAGRRTVEERYSWDVVGRTLRASYATLM
ncbi:MAG TPA: glycosyltransferase family 4 protein [Gemmatimonadaceae bacterium]|nr:glycosyltransferase family 4 protein [Gemmatimonadaceae bacterium]